MKLTDFFLGCLALIEFIQLILKLLEIETDPPLTEEMRRKLYS